MRESLNYALLQAAASPISVMVYRRSIALIVRTIDNGVGFEVDAATGGLGLENLRTRAAGLGGYIEITSTDGQGTTVEVSLPL